MTTPQDGTDPFGDPFKKPEPGLDHIGWYIAISHSLLGHDKTAALIGADPGDKRACLICQYEHDPTPERKRAVIGAIGRPA
jgi:hypothetical protein